MDVDGCRRVGAGSRSHSASPIALDIAVANALGDNHWDETRQAGGTACSQYARRKRQHNRTEALCLAAGVQYLPLVWEAQGGCAAETRAFLHRLTGLVAVVDGLSHEVVKGRLADQLAVLLARAGGRALRRRRALPCDHISLQHDAIATLCLDP